MQQIKEKPILFNPEMARAVLDGRKTQTRRTLKLPDDVVLKSPSLTIDLVETSDGLCAKVTDDMHFMPAYWIKCPYSEVGTKLWVRETFSLESNYGYQGEYDKPENPLGPVLWDKDAIDGKFFVCPRYRASEPDTDLVCEELENGDYKMKWQPSIHMKREYSRINLEITNIRVERVQDITPEDALAEGINHSTLNCPKVEFQHLWDSINASPKPIYCRNEAGKKIISHYIFYPWEDVNEERIYRGKTWYVYGNPYVWVVEFKEI